MKRTHNGTRIDYDGIGEIRKSLESRRLEKERDVTSRYVLVISVLNSANSKQALYHHIYIYIFEQIFPIRKAHNLPFIYFSVEYRF